MRKEKIYRISTGSIFRSAARFITRFWALILVVSVIATSIAFFLALNLGIDTDIMHILPSDEPAVDNFREISANFGLTDKLIAVVKPGNNNSYHEIIGFMDSFADSLADSPMIKNVEYKLPHIYFNDAAEKPEDKFNLDYKLYASNDGREYLIFIFAVQPSGDIEFSGNLIKEVLSIENKVKKHTLAEKDIMEIEYTGGYVIGLNESLSIRKNIYLSILTSFIFVIVLFFLFFRKIGIIVAVSIPLFMSIIWTLASAYLMIGELNILTIAFSAILIGIGIDFGIHIYNRYSIEFSSGKDHAEALHIAIITTGESIFFSCITTSIAFYSLVFMKFRGAVQFGLLIGSGVVLCMISMLFVLPSLIIFSHKMKPGIKKGGKENCNRSIFAAFIEKRSKITASVFIILLIFFSFYAYPVNGFPKFNNKLDAMSSRDNTAVIIQKNILINFGNYYEPIIIVAKGSTPEEASEMLGELTPALSDLKESGLLVKYESLSKYLPSHDRGEYLISRINRAQQTSNPIQRLIRSVRKKEDDVDYLLKRLSEDPLKKDEYEYLLKKKDIIVSIMKTDFSDKEIKLSDIKELIPAELSEKFFAYDKKKNVYYEAAYIYPKRRLDNPGETGYLRDKLNIDGNNIRMTGMGIMAGSLEALIKKETRIITAMVLIALALILTIIYRQLSMVVISLFLISASLWATIIIMSLAGIKFNYMNIIAFPLIVGMGIDDSIHMLHRYFEKEEKSIYNMLSSTGRAVVLTSLTTIIGFGSLCLSKHNGLISLGLVTSIGIASCLSVTLFILPGIITFIEDEKKRRHILNRTVIYRGSVYIAGFLPVWVLRAIARSVAFLSYVFLPECRENIKKNLSHLYKDPDKINKLTRKIFLNYGSYVADWAKLNHMREKDMNKWFCSIEGKEVMEEGFRRGKGIILLTAHLGNWELGGIFFSRINIPINVITAQDDIQGVADVREKSRRFHNIKTITINNNTLFFVDIINALKKNEIVAMLLDRYQGGKSVTVDFFDKPKMFPAGPAQIARLTGAAIAPAFVTMDSDGKYRAVVDSIVEMDFSDDIEKDLNKNTEKIVKVFEKYIREYSDQWYNFSYMWDEDPPKD